MSIFLMPINLRVYFHGDYWTSNQQTFNERKGHELFSMLTSQDAVKFVVYKMTQAYPTKIQDPHMAFRAKVYGYVKLRVPKGISLKQVADDVLGPYMRSPPYLHLRLLEYKVSAIRSDPPSKRFHNIFWRTFFESRATWL